MAKIKLAADFSDFLKLCLRNEVGFIISLEDLKINKLASGRPKDMQDLEELP